MHVSLLLVLKESIAAWFACLCTNNHVDLCAQVCKCVYGERGVIGEGEKGDGRSGTGANVHTTTRPDYVVCTDTKYWASL